MFPLYLLLYSFDFRQLNANSKAVRSLFIVVVLFPAQELSFGLVCLFRCDIEQTERFSWFKRKICIEADTVER